jgi:hypothetical protein
MSTSNAAAKKNEPITHIRFDRISTPGKKPRRHCNTHQYRICSAASIDSAAYLPEDDAMNDSSPRALRRTSIPKRLIF